MPLNKLWTLAYRDLGRNRRRSILTLLAVALGLALLMLMNGYIAGVMEDTLQNSIRLRTGHVQIRASSYEEEKLSLQAKDLLASPYFFSNDTATTEIYTLSLHDALPIAPGRPRRRGPACGPTGNGTRRRAGRDRKSTRLNSSHVEISYAVFCLKKKN